MAAFWIYLPAVFVAMAWSLRALGIIAPPAFVAGLLLWTLLEYGLHRFAFHGFAPHYEHHAQPAETKYILTPLWFSLPVAVVLLAAVRAAAGSWSLSAAVAAGTLAGYLFYEWLHLRIHRSTASGRLMRLWRRQHYYHHFADSTVAYGVTSPLWDYVFGTAKKQPASPRMV